MTAATLQELSGGRLLLGLGADRPFGITVEGSFGTDWINAVLAVQPDRVMIQWHAADGIQAIEQLARKVF